jgi:GGDEF domain-containing protein
MGDKMGIAEAEKYIQNLHKKQGNPYLWPDYLTGLPDKAAIIKKMDEVSPKLGEYSIAYIEIANIQPYLLHYGPDKHAEIIQWAAAIIKTTADKCSASFVGTFDTHDFIIMCKTKNMPNLFKRVQEIFRKKVSTYYSKKDLAEGVTFSFVKNDGKKVNYGLMKFIAVIADKKLRVRKSHLIRNMTRICDAIEGTEDEIIVMSNDMILRD